MMEFRGGIALIKKSLFGFVASRGFFWTLTLGWMMAPLIYMFVWVVAAGDGNISGFSKNDFITYYVFLIFVNQLTYPTSHWTVGDNIFNGTFSIWLLRPLPPIYEAIASDIAVKIVCMPFALVFIVALSFIFKIQLAMEVSHIIIFIITLIFAQILRFMTSYTISIMALFTSKISALLSINNTLVFLLAGQVIPTVLLLDSIKKIALYLPYRYMIGFPIELLLGKLNSGQIMQGIFIQVIWIILILIIHRIVWERGLKHYSSVGG